MFTSRDYVLRQIHQLVQALATLLGKKGAIEKPEIEALLSTALVDATGVDLENIRRMDRDGILVLCEHGGSFNSEFAVALADLLAQDNDQASRERAAWLLQAALRAGGTLPLDIHDRIAALLTPAS